MLLFLWLLCILLHRTFLQSSVTKLSKYINSLYLLHFISIYRDLPFVCPDLHILMTCFLHFDCHVYSDEVLFSESIISIAALFPATTGWSPVNLTALTSINLTHYVSVIK